MYAVKGGWVGQTFALARRNDSEGRKSRIRRSKEERKAMVESFIKKYQKSNSGNFPSLNLTHKEVGGSFYTVREIVRDIIQENRVLGPAKLSPEEQGSDQFLEQRSNDHFLQGTSEELVLGSDGLGSDGHNTGPDYQVFENGRIVNGNQVELTNQKSDGLPYLELQVSELTGAEKHLEEEWAASMEKLTLTTAEEEQVLVSDGNVSEYQVPDNGQSVNSAKLTCTEYQVSKPSESEGNIEEKLSTPEAKVNPIAADVMVEVFPLLPVTVTVDNLNESSLGEARDLINPLEEKEIEKVELEPGNGSFLSDGMNSVKSSNLGDYKSVANLSGSVDKEVVEDLVEPSFEDSNCSAPGEGIKDDSCDAEVFEAKVYRNDVGTPQPLEKGQELAEAEALSAPNNVHTNILNDTYTGSSSGEVNVPRMSVNQPKADVQCSGLNSQKGSNPTLDRINLESWKTTRRSGKPENNPLLDTIKAFVVAFIKFWTE
ncbi:uncharacterized protein LOC121263312 isoform X2 [Juglans microcarpa x Juglans regia]|uniref:uncharacterized protein LOC121263312 isoform X2 n=1 Tax=Juglans microcarpa x Juglans regia TaxID=2249226 RepID=UPI001B7DD40E|nr:uncharacterized protein LOC121263312 isoform X2 [Juglans microcarpa x Juglans regia]